MFKSKRLFFFLFSAFSRNVRQRSKPILKNQNSSAIPEKIQETQKISSEQTHTINIFSKSPLDKILGRSENFPKLLENFNFNLSEFNVGNYISFLHHAIRLFSIELNKKKEDVDLKNPPLKRLLDYKELQIALTYVKENIHKLDSFRTTVFISKITKIGYYDIKLIEKIIMKILELNIQLSIQSLSFIVWAMAKTNFKDAKFLEFASEQILKAEVNLS